MSHWPQKPTYVASPRVVMAVIELSGSVAEDDAAGSPGAVRVPRSKTLTQVLVESSASAASVKPEVVLGPSRVSTTSRPAVTRCWALVGSIAKGLENRAAVNPGSMLDQLEPPSVVTEMAPLVYSS